jgi:putative sigma-54 modulation protein
MTIETHQINVPFSEALRQFVDERVKASLRRHIDYIGRVTVRLADVNGPRHGAADKVCRLRVELEGTGALVAVGESHDVYAAVRDAAHRIGRAIDHTMSRKQRR